MNVIKRDGSTEQFSVEKLNRVVIWACQGYDANPSDILMNAKLQLHDGIRTTKIHEVLVASTRNLISLKSPDYQYVASRLQSFFLRKQIFDVYLDEDMPSVAKVIETNINLGLYDPALASKFNAEDMKIIEKTIDHSNDEKLTMASYQKLHESYFVRNRSTGYVYETPQYMFMVLSMAMNDNIEDVKSYYSDLVHQRISLPTPIAAGVRTTTKQFASCTLIDVGDSLDSIYSSAHAIGRFVSRKAGIGLAFNRTRSLGDSIRNGDVVHTGKIPFLKLMQGATKSCSQGGVRDGSTTVALNIWDPEIEDLLVLKNNKGSDDNRVRHMDYSIQISGLFWKRMLSNQKISLFSTFAAPKLIDAWGLPEFDELYTQYELNSSIPRVEIMGQELLLLLTGERLGTGRIYIMNIDNVQEQNMFLDRINMSNLCQEITLPTKPLHHIDDENGEIALCNLGGLNLGFLKTAKSFPRMEKPIKNIVRTLDNVIDLQDYPVKAAEWQLKRRSIGVGVTNFAYWMAKNGLRYDDPAALPLIDELFEHFQFYLLKASMELAKERGPAPLFHRTKYALGMMPYDVSNSEANKLVDRELTCDWEWLKGEIAKYGLRNSVLSAQMPVESSSLVTNSTNGIEPPRSLITTKINKSGVANVMLVPGAKALSQKYTLSWDLTSNDCINKITAIMQKWIDQAISVNHYYNPMMFPGQKVPAKILIKDMIDFYKLGGKNLYYANTLDAIESDDTVDCAGGACTL